jgi:phytoene synthase
MSASDAEGIDYLAKLVRDLDRPRYFATLFGPERFRPDLFALYGFAAEIERIPHLVTDARLGEIRLQFWQDRLETAGEPNDPGSPPLLRELLAAVARHALPLPPLVALIEARRADLYSDPPGTLADAEGLLGETQSSVFQLAALIAGSSGAESADAAGHAGVAYGLARRLANLGHDQARRRTILPFDVLQGHGIGSAELFASETPPKLSAVIATMLGHARRHLAAARAALAQLPRELHPPFLPLAAVEPLLRRIEQLGPAILERPAALSDLEMLVHLGWARLSGLGRGRRAV